MSGEFSPAAFAELKRRVVTATHLGDVWNYFLTTFINRPGFLALGQRVEIENAVQVLDAAAGMMLDRPGPIPGRNLMLIHLPGAGIIHGTGLYDGQLAAVVYVPEFDVGIMALCGGGQMRFSRFWVDDEARAVA